VHYRGLLGYVAIVGLCYGLSSNRRAIKWRPVIWGLGLQFALAALVLNPVAGEIAFRWIDRGISALLACADAGIDFLFTATQEHQVSVIDPTSNQPVVQNVVGHMSPVLRNFAFSILPVVIFFSALTTLLYHLGVMQRIVSGMSKLMRRALGTSGAETLSATANIFVGQTEAPLLIRPFIEKMTRSELFSVMVCGFATVAGAALGMYVGILRHIPGIAGHLVTASIMAAPGALALAKIVEPETDSPETAGDIALNMESQHANAIDAVSSGATEGMKLVLNMAAMLVAFVSMVALINALLGIIPLGGGVVLSIERILGWFFSPLAWLMGVPWSEAKSLGVLLGEKLVLTELIAYIHLGEQSANFSARTSVMGSYALCGFANLASVGIQLGGIGAMAPGRRSDLARLGLKSMFIGTLVSCMSATLAGLLTR